LSNVKPRPKSGLFYFAGTNTLALISRGLAPKSGTKHDRDNNAAINILNQGLKELGLTA